MSVAEMKKTILDKVEILTEEQLNEVKKFIDELAAPHQKEYNLLRHVDSIVSEREEVLKKLAQ